MGISAGELPAPGLRPAWSPSQQDREALVHSLALELSAPSGLLGGYGPLPLEEAAAVSRGIEQAAFAAVPPPAPATDFTETLALYSREVSDRVFDFCWARRAASSSPTPAPAAAAAAAATAVAGEETPPSESESTQA